MSRQRLRQIYRLGLVVVAVAIALVWQQLQSPNETLTAGSQIEVVSEEREPIQAIPIAVSYDLDKYTLGEKLFKEPRLSKDGQVSCASCHLLEAGGADSRRYSKGVADTVTRLNTPTVFNVAYSFRFNWNGQYDNLAAHTDALVQNPTVMAGKWDEIVQTMSEIDDYRQAFKTIYRSGVNKENIIDAIVTYELALTTPNAAFDQYLQGDTSAISASAKSGYDLFKTYGCASCHQGTNVGGNMFQQFGVIGDYFSDRGNITQADLGRFNATGKEADRYVFRVPSLRNVAVTPPYLHDGSARTLREAIKIMVKYQLGRPIPPADIELIAEFLETLTGEISAGDVAAK